MKKILTIIPFLICSMSLFAVDQSTGLESNIELWQLLIAVLGLGITIIGTIVAGWVTLRIQVTKIETETRVKIIEIEKQISDSKKDINNHTTNLNAINISLPQMKSDILGELSPMKTDIAIIKSHFQNTNK